MSKDKVKGFSRFERQFFAPFSLEESQARLQKQARKPIKSALRGDSRIRVEMLDSGHAFQIYIASRFSAELNVKAPTTRARGLLAPQADGTTQVLVYAGTTAIGYLLHWLPLGLIWLILSLLLIRFGFISLLLSPFILIAMTVWSNWVFDREHELLLSVVEKALNPQGVEMW